MSEVDASIVIAAPVGVVWDTALDPDRLGAWVTIHRRLGERSPGPLRRGFEMEQTLALRGVSIHVAWVLVEAQPPHSAVWHGHGPARSHAEIKYDLSALDSASPATEFRYRNRFTAPLGALGAVATRTLVNALSHRETELSLKRLKALVEREA